MTIAAKLSRKLYETLGDEAAETMVDWMQGADAHRVELRELNDIAFDRFDARLGERLAEARQELHGEISTLRQDLIRFEARMDKTLDAKLDAKVSELRQEMHAELAGLRQELRSEIAELRQEIGRLGKHLDTRYADLIKWSFAFWIGSTVTLMLGMAAIARIGR